MDFEIRRSLVLSFMLSTLITGSGYTTQQSVISYYLGRSVDASTANTLINDHAKFLEYKNQVQPLSDMAPEEYIKIKTNKPHVPVAELVSTHIARQELSRLSIVPTFKHEEAASHLLSVGHKGFDTSYLESVIELQTDPDKTGLIDKKPSPARITAMAFLKKATHKPTEPELEVMAYIVDPGDEKIKEPKLEEFQAAMYLMDRHTPVIAKPTADEIQAAAFLLAGVMGNPSKTEVEAAAYLMAGLIPKPTAREVVAAEALLAGPILKPSADEVRAAEELMRMHVPPTAATVAAILYFKLPTIRIAKPSPEFLNAAAYLMDPLACVIEKPTPEEIQAAEVLLDRVKMTAPTAAEVKAMLYFINKGILPAPTEWEVRAGAYLMDNQNHAPIIPKPNGDEIKAAAYLQAAFRMLPISKPTAQQVEATAYLQTTSIGKMEDVIAARPTLDQVDATLILWNSQFGQKPYMNASLSHIQAVSKGTTGSQKSLIAWFVQKTGGDIPGGVAEVLQSDFHYQYFRFAPVNFDVMASKAAPCLFSAGNYGSTGTDGFRVFKKAYSAGLKEGEQFVFETLVCDKARTDAVTITGIDKP